MKRFDRVRQILDEAVGGATLGAHGAFWRGLTREALLVKRVFGLAVVTPGNAEASNLIKALEGRVPFGQDTGAIGATYRRMPAGRPPVPAGSIAFIRDWIDAGCPDDDVAGDVDAVDVADRPKIDPKLHNAFWRDFDNWAMFQASQEVQDAIGVFFEAAPKWMGGLVQGALIDWIATVSANPARAAIQTLASRQIQTVQNHYGKPIRGSELVDSFELFGSAALPPDPLRPHDDEHNMNGASMWFFWSAFVDAAIRLQLDAAWPWMGRCVLVGLLNDGVFRGRFAVNGFPRDEASRAAIRAHALTLPDAGLTGELGQRFVDSGLGTPT